MTPLRRGEHPRGEKRREEKKVVSIHITVWHQMIQSAPIEGRDIFLMGHRSNQRCQKGVTTCE